MNATQIWELYQKAQREQAANGLPYEVERAHKFYEGEQWFGVQDATEGLPSYNFIRPTVNYRASMVAMNQLAIVFGECQTNICSTLTKMAEQSWEHANLDSLSWQIIKNSCIAGDSYLYFYDDKQSAQVVDSADIFFADEHCTNIQSQQWIIVRERVLLPQMKEQAKRYGVPKAELDRITAESDGRCTGLLYMTKKDGVVHICRSVKELVYQPLTKIGGETGGLALYPVAAMVWNRKRGSCRGVGEVKPLIDNQIECNRNLARRLASAKLCAYSKPVYNSTYVQNAEELSEVGTSIEVEGTVADVRQAVAYLAPASMSSDAHILGDELLNRTRELAGAGDAALGNVDPSKTSGAAILAARDQSAIPLTEQTAVYKQFVEDIARIWLDSWCAYHPKGIEINERQVISVKELRKMQANIRVDITPTDPYSKFAVEQSLEKALASGYIDFAEYVQALPDNSIAPKAKFTKILQERSKDNAV